tara:strand:- start:5815 stop:6300 length:486 start_codon:yes stop_codon:yes gene_type:complete
MKKLDNKYDLDKIRHELTVLYEEYEIYFDLIGQILIQSPNGDNWTDIRAPYKIDPDLRETDFIKPNTPDDWEMTRFMLETDVCRTRVLRLKPRECYSWHRDVGDRLHLAVDTHEACFFIEDGNMRHIPSDGHPYKVDVSLPHTALNGSLDIIRTHLVGVLR